MPLSHHYTYPERMPAMQLTIVGGGGFRVPAMIDVLARSRSGQGAYASLDVDRVVMYDTD